MEIKTEQKLVGLGIPSGYEGFRYMCFLVSEYSLTDITALTLKEVESVLTEKFGVSEKAVIHNLTLLSKRTWDKGIFRRIMKWQAEPTLKEFVFSVLMITELSA